MTEIEYLKKYLHEEDNLEEAIKRLKNGEPVQYIVGDVDFYGNIFKVNKNVLIPRPETEELVEKTNNIIKKYFSKRDLEILDIGTGSGCIAISLKKLFPNSKVSAVDISKEALEVAIENANLNAAEVKFYQSNIFSNVKNKFDIIISNPPYIREDEKIMDIVKNNEPHLALYAPNKGLYFYDQILKNAKYFLNEDYLIAFEIGQEQANDIKIMANKYLPNSNVVISKDLQKLDRYVFITNKSIS